MAESGTLGRMTEPAGHAVTTALITELARKTGVSWLRYGAAAPAADTRAENRADNRADADAAHDTHAVWHLWFDDSLYVLSGGEEQSLPGIENVERVEVMMRSKDNGGRLLTWVALASDVRPDDELWEPVTAALAAGRLNVANLAAAPAGWAETSRVTRLLPTGETVEDPDNLDDDAHLATPPPTPATTRGPLPRVLHRRVKRRPRLS